MGGSKSGKADRRLLPYRREQRAPMELCRLPTVDHWQRNPRRKRVHLKSRFGRRVLVPAWLLSLMIAYPAGAQPVQAPSRAEAEAALDPAPAPFTNAQFDQILAPIALYPDQLLVQVLMAATFPDQLVDAQKWLQDSSNAALKGDDLVNVLQPLPWDPSVKSLVAFPQIISMMTDHLDWTEALGTAFANQQVETMARVQFLRDRAVQAGQLKSSSQLAVTGQASDISIEAADPNMVYVPVYNPAEVYGTWPDSDAPPVYIPPPPGFYNGALGGALGAGIAFSVGFGVVAPLWGWGHPDWQHHRVDVDPGRYQHITNQNFITQNHITVEGGAWHRTGPIAQIPQTQRPQPREQNGELPKGTIHSSEVAHWGMRPGEPPPHPGGPPHPTAEEAHPSEASRPGEPPHPAAEQAHPGEPPRPGETPHPGEPHPAAEEAHPGEPPHPGPQEAHPGEPPHPAAQEAHPGEPPHPGPQEAHPQEAQHPAEAPHPQPPPHPAGPPPQAHPGPPPQAHPGPPPHPAGPQRPPPKPGEEQPPR
jgi:hypothetical protein